MPDNETYMGSGGNNTKWTVETLKEYVDVQFTGLRNMLEERFQMQTKAVDAAFSAQQMAMQTAKTEQGIAMVTALAAQKEAVQTAMAAAEKAVAKAEASADKRFESVNEFRAQLADQATTFASKSDVDIRMKGLADKLEYEAQHLEDMGNMREKAIANLELRLSRRLDLAQGEDTGTAESRSNKRSDTSVNIAIGSIVLAVISVVITIITVLSKSAP
jgi:hypothetical protein